MWTNEQIEITGWKGRRIYNRMYRREGGAPYVTVLIAGYAYTLESPYNFYSKQVPWDAGHDVLTIDFEYCRNEEFAAVSNADRERWFVDDVDGVATALRELFSDRRFVLIGKSLGSTAIYRISNDETLGERIDGYVWMTPSERRHRIIDLATNSDRPSLFVYGDEDRYVRDMALERLDAAPQVETLVVRGGDHALETQRVEDSLLYLREYVTCLRRFFSNAERQTAIRELYSEKRRFLRDPDSSSDSR